jgi:endonuclease/exonuclease/phosphatase (EEP) superfamily protein YafD
MGRRGWKNLWAALILALAVAGFAAERRWAVHLIPQAGMLCALVAAACLWRRLWVGAALWGIAGVAALTPVLPSYVPHAAAPRPGCTLTVVTFNQYEGRPDDAAAAALLARLHPDVIFAQKAYDNVHLRDALLAQGFSGYFSFPSPTRPDLILSRIPIEHAEDDRVGIWTDVAVEGRTVRLKNMYATRPNRSWTEYLDYHEQLLRQVDAHTGPLVLAGDANSTAFTPEMRALRRRLRDAWDEAGFGAGMTFPAPWRRFGLFGPWMRIDYVLHDEAFDAVAARRIADATAAGHYPVWAELVLAGSGTAGAPCR